MVARAGVEAFAPGDALASEKIGALQSFEDGTANSHTLSVLNAPSHGWYLVRIVRVYRKADGETWADVGPVGGHWEKTFLLVSLRPAPPKGAIITVRGNHFGLVGRTAADFRTGENLRHIPLADRVTVMKVDPGTLTVEGSGSIVYPKDVVWLNVANWGYAYSGKEMDAAALCRCVEVKFYSSTLTAKNL